MIERTQGVVLRVRPLTETSLIVHWLTQDLGRIATVAKGARRPKSAFRGKLDLFYLAELSFRRSRKSELHALAEINLLETFPIIRQDVMRLQQASYCVELLELCTETETPIPRYHALAIEFLNHLVESAPDALNVLSFELKLLHESGLMPDIRNCGLNREAANGALVLAEAPWEVIRNLCLPREPVREIADLIAMHWRAELPRAPRTRDRALGLS